MNSSVVKNVQCRQTTKFHAHEIKLFHSIQYQRWQQRVVICMFVLLLVVFIIFRNFSTMKTPYYIYRLKKFVMSKQF